MSCDKIICGIDEAGRGPLAGPVFAAAVILPTDFDAASLADSKKLSEKKRTILAEKIFAECLFGIGTASVREIDSLNILRATMLAMKRAYCALSKKILASEKKRLDIIVDGNRCPDIQNARTMIKADGKIPAVMAASIIAKVSRDTLMIHYAEKFPEYGFECHKGYGTKAHVAAIHRYGLCPIHRKTFHVPCNE